PVVPDLAVALIPARFVPDTIDACGKFGIKRMAIPSGGFNEMGEEGKKLAQLALDKAAEYDLHFVGPNGVTVANTANGLCLPFVPSYMPTRGGLSVITQSGGVGLMLWNLITDEDVGMAKFASIGNKLNLDEVDFLEYFGRDPETTVICLYLESIPRGEAFLRAAEKINKPIIVLKSNTTEAGNKAAVSHTAALSNNDSIIDTAFERAGIIRINSFPEFISVAKAFELPPMKGENMMFMSPAGGFAVMMADLCEKVGLNFADPGEKFFDELNKFSNAGIINFSNPLDMGDIYDPKMYAHIFYSVMHNDNIDGAVYVSQWPEMPRGEDVFYKMFHTDLSRETIGAIRSSGKPLGVCLFGPGNITSRIKKNLNIPIFDNPDEMVLAMKKQQSYYAKKNSKAMTFDKPSDIDFDAIEKWLSGVNGIAGEETLDLLKLAGIPVAESFVASSPEEAVKAASKLGYPVVLKVVSPDALHKSDAGGVLINIRDDEGVKEGFQTIKKNLFNYKKDADFTGVRVMKMADEGYDMFIGGNYDHSFGPVAFFGFGGIYIEVFKDVQSILCPSNSDEISTKISRLKSLSILEGARGAVAGDVKSYIDVIERISHVLGRFREIKELDINPIRILADGSGVVALDARVVVG
ncbi:MAG: acetate--CoA ligase family protein, partial [Bacteroidales bacterium]|nr:acetate--CoA ligase family protein [Bacteroidales bacterium]